MTVYVSPTVASYYGVQAGQTLMVSGQAGFTAAPAGQAWASSQTGQATYAALDIPTTVTQDITDPTVAVIPTVGMSNGYPAANVVPDLTTPEMSDIPDEIATKAAGSSQMPNAALLLLLAVGGYFLLKGRFK